MKETRRTLFICNIAGFSYYEGFSVMGKLKIGDRLTLSADLSNRFDPTAVEIRYGDSKLGYLPSDRNTTIFNILDMGWEDMFDVRVVKLAGDEHPERQVGISVGICRK